MQRRRRAPDIEPRGGRPRAPLVRRDATIELTPPPVYALLSENSDDTSVGKFQQASFIKAGTVELRLVLSFSTQDRDIAMT